MPQLQPGQAFILRDGEVGQFEITRRDNHVIVTAGNLSASLVVTDPEGQVSPLDSDGSILLPDDSHLVGVDVSGFQPDSDVETWMYSEPTRLGVATVHQSGQVSANYPVPRGVDSGRHRVVLSGSDSDGNDITIALGVRIGKDSRTSSTGRVVFAMVLLLAAVAGIFFPAVVRRRRREEETTVV